MARSLRIEYPGVFYHVTSRGNERKDVFKNQKDRERFLSYLESATKRYDAVIHVYCLMSKPLSSDTGFYPEIFCSQTGGS
jgi:REP element-mobilizing transposase RayT